MTEGLRVSHTEDLGEYLRGTVGDDIIYLNGLDLARGGPGADLFVAIGPYGRQPADPLAPRPPLPPSHIADFTIGEDRLVIPGIDLSAGADPVADGRIRFTGIGEGTRVERYDSASGIYGYVTVLDGVNPADLTWAKVAGVEPTSNLIGFNTSRYSLLEGGEIDLEVVRIGDTSAAASVSWNATGTSPNAASADDFSSSMSGILTFAAGKSTATITIQTQQDSASEADEYLRVILFNPSQGQVATGAVTVEILNDDGATAPNEAEGHVVVSGGGGSNVIGGDGNDTLQASAGPDALWGGLGSDVFVWSQAPYSPAAVTDFTVFNDRIDFSAPLGAAAYAGSSPVADGYIRVVPDGVTSAVQFDPDGPSGPRDFATVVRVENYSFYTWAYLTNNVPQISFKTTAGVADEASGSMTYTLVRTGPIDEKSFVTWGAYGQGPNPADYYDFVTPGGMVTFAPGESQKDLVVKLTTDSKLEPDEAFEVRLFDPYSATVVGGPATGVIHDTGAPPPPPKPLVSISADQSKPEGDSGSTAFTFTVTRTGDASPGLSTVHWTVAGSGAAPVGPGDFSPATYASGDLDLSSERPKQTITVNVLGDTRYEADETFSVTLSNPTNAVIDRAQAIATILNDDAPPPPPPADNGGEVGRVYTAPSAGAVVVGGTGPDTIFASEAADTLTGGGGADRFVLSKEPWAPVHITDFTPGRDVLDLSAFFQKYNYAGYDPVDDRWIWLVSDGAGGTIVRFDRDGAGPNPQTPTTFVDLEHVSPIGLTWSQLSGAAPGGSSGSTSALSLTTSRVALAEGDAGSTAFTYTVTRTGDAAATASVHWSVVGSGANPAGSNDFTGAALPSGNLAFAVGETSKIITVDVAGDTAAESDEEFTVTLSGAVGATLGATNATGLITNDDAPAAGADGQVYTATQIRSVLTGGSGADTFNGSEAGDTLTGGAGGDLFHFAKKPWEPTHITDFQVGADKLDLWDVLKAAGYKGADPIADKYISFADNGAGGTKVLFDKDGVATGQQWPERILELDGLGYNPGNASQMLGAPGSSGGVVIAPPAPPTISLVPSSVSHPEGTSAPTAFVYTVTRTGDTAGPSTVKWAVAGSGNSPADASDFTGFVLPAGTLSFAAGETTKAITVNVAGDATPEADEGFAVTLSAPTGATLGTATASGLIGNDDTTTGGGSTGGGSAGQVYTAPGTYSTMTGTAGADTFNGSQAGDTITGGAGADLFHFANKPWDPTHITDFQVGTDKLDLSDLLKAVGYTGSDPIADKYISFADNGAGGTKVLFDKDGVATGQQWPDRIIELDHTAYNPANASQMLAGSTSTGGGGTTTPPAGGSATIALTTTSVSHAEGVSGSTAFAYTLTRSGDTTGSASVHWTVSGSGSSPANATDFTGAALPSGDVTFAAGETTKTITVNVAGDTTVETDEGFTVTLSGATGATLGVATATGLITNDDTASGGGSTGGGSAGQVYTAPGTYSTLTGTAGNDTFNASQAGDTITGGAGADVFHFGTKPWDPTHITDFDPSTDKLDLSDLLKAVGYTGSNAVADHYVSWMDNGAGGTKILFDKDGSGTGQQWPDRIIELDHTSVASLNASSGWLIT